MRRPSRALAPRVGVVFALLLGLALATPPALPQGDDAERQQAETRLRAILDEIERLSAGLEAARGDHRAEQARLRELDLAVQQASRAFHALQQERRGHEAEIEALEQQKRSYLDSLDDRTAQLAGQMRAAYRNGRQSRVRLVLNLDDPDALTRMLAYYDHVNRAQADRIGALKEALGTLERMERDIDRKLAELALVEAEQQALLDDLSAQREHRAALLARISDDIERDQSTLRELEQDRRDLEALIERLADVLADIPLDLDQRAGIGGRKGRLSMPVAGPVRHAFGQPRGAGLRWQGWLIGADAGSEVRSVAYGRVAFADWLRGYGLLMIIDHGDGFMSLYGHNESLLQDAGAWVEAGEAVSVVGSNPGTTQGLYFELRRDGKAIDPAAWIDRRSGS